MPADTGEDRIGVPWFADQQFIICAKGTETNRLVKDWIDHEVGRCRQPVVLGVMQAIREMAKR